MRGDLLCIRLLIEGRAATGSEQSRNGKGELHEVTLLTLGSLLCVGLLAWDFQGGGQRVKKQKTESYGGTEGPTPHT